MPKAKNLLKNDIYIASDIRRSILECRTAYHEMTDQKFADWYERRYRINENVVLAVLQEQKKSPL